MQVNFGRFDVIGEKNVASGMASGLNTKAIVDGLVSARQINVTRLEDKLKFNDEKVAAYSELGSVLTTLSGFADSLRSSPYYGYASQDTFQKRQVFVNSSDGSAGNNYIGMAAANGALVNKYSLTVDNLATPKYQISQVFSSNSTSVVAATSTTGKFTAGTFQINGKDITLTTDDSLLTIKAKINAITEDTNVIADIIQADNSDFYLTISSKDTGVANAFAVTDASNVMQNISFTVTAAIDAKMHFNNVEITRGSNTISDVIDNVTFSLYQPTPTGVKLTAEIAPDTKSMFTAIKQFALAYNDVKAFAAKMQQIDPRTGMYTKDAILGGDQTLVGAINGLMGEISSSVNGLSGAVTKLADIGVMVEDFAGDKDNLPVKNILELDDSQLQSLLDQNSDLVRKLFEFSFSTSSPNLTLTTRTNALTVTDFTVDINTSRAAGDQVRITYNDGTGNVTINADYTASASGGVIVGKDGTALEGLTMYYAGAGVDSISVSVSQGVADRVYNLIDTYINKDDGIITVTSNNLISSNQEFNDQIQRKNVDIDRYRDRLLEQYAAVEEAISKVNSILDLLDAQARARDSYGR